MSKNMQLEVTVPSTRFVTARGRTIHVFIAGADKADEFDTIDIELSLICTDDVVFPVKFNGVNVMPLSAAVSSYGAVHYSQYDRPFSVANLAAELRSQNKGANDLNIHRMYTVVSFDVPNPDA